MERAAPNRVAALIVAAGRGRRAGSGIPKQYRPLAGRPVLSRTLAAFLDHPQITQVATVIHPDDADAYAAAAPPHRRLAPPVHGGASRAESVLNGLRALAADPPEAVLIHDAARPLIDAGAIARVVAALAESEGAVAALPAVDSMRRADATGAIVAPVDRAGLWRMQTPQGFRFGAILEALERAARDGALEALTDDVEAARSAGLAVRVVPGDPTNLKLTTAEDFAMAERLLGGGAPDIRFGQGFDVHAFGPGDAVTLCGVRVPHERGLVGHSDADVGLHALADAIFGALADGDIGRHFPPSDPQWKGADSALFLERAAALAAERGYRIGSLDVTLICERPKIGPHAEAMRARVAAICAVAPDRVSVKATTTERLGFPGRGEGIAALAGACLVGAITSS